MTIDAKHAGGALSRRRLLSGAGALGGAAILGIPAATPAAAFGPAPGQNWAEWAAANTPRKSTQHDADYHVAASGPRCATCANFMPPNRCAIVLGDSAPDGTCKLYYKKR